jgi:LacI family transcriptional regulator
MNRKNSISLKDIAKELDVSIALVSYVLNGKEKEKRVGAEKAALIKKSLQEHNYIPNHVARSLRNGSTKTIGLIVTDIANTFFSSLARICEDEAKKYGYTIVFGSSDENPAKSDLLMNTLITRQVDGLIIVPSEGSNNHLKSLVENETPLVLIDRFIPGLAANYVVLDNYAACMDACTHLIRKGKKDIVMFAYKSSLIHMKDRIKGYEDAMKKYKLEDHIRIIEVGYEDAQQEIHTAISNLTSGTDKIDAFLFATNTLSITGLYSIQKLNLKVPDEIAVIGFDGSVAFDFFYSPLSYIRQPMDEMAKEAVRLIIEQIKGTKKTSQVVLKPELVLRESSG